MKNFKQILSKQSAEARPWIIWIWNLAITKDEMLSQLKALISSGFGGIVIRPGKNMVPTYLSEEFFALFKSALEIARQYNIGVRIADDFSMPWSGCFTSLLNQNKSLRAQCLVLAETKLCISKETFDFSTDDPKSAIVLAAKAKNQQVSLTEVKQLQLFADRPLHWKAPPGEWRIFVFKKEFVRDLAGGYIPNVYNTRTAQLYIQYVLNVFKKRFSRFAGNTFKGFVSEMPAYRPADGSIPWDDDLVVKFRTKYKKDLFKYLPSLFFDAPQAARIRNQVYAYLDQSMYERFALPLEVWARNSHLSQWTLCPERSIHRTANALVDGDFHAEKGLASVGIQNLDGIEDGFPMLRAMIDTNTNEYKRGTIAVIGRNRTGAAATPQSLKSEIDTSLISGATQIVIDGCFFALDQRSYVKTAHNPVWYTHLGSYFKPLCDYAARMQELLQDVLFSRPVAVLSPAAAIKAIYTPANGEPARSGNGLLQKTANSLVHQNLDFDTVSEEYLLHCQVKTGGEFGKIDRKGKGNYLVLLVPYAPLLSRSLLVFLEKLVSKRGTVLFVNDGPKGTFEDGVNASVTKRIERMLNPKKSKSRIVPLEELERVLAEIPFRIKLRAHDETTPDILSAAGSFTGGSMYCFSNRSERQEYTVKAEIPLEKRLTFIDCDSGTMTEITDVQREGNLSRFNLHLLPQRTVLLAGTGSPLAPPPTKQTKAMITPFSALQRSYRIVLKNQWTIEPATMNALPLSNWNLRIGLSRERGGFSHFYESYFQVATLPEECFLVMSNPGGHHASLLGAEQSLDISVNGTRVDKPVVPSTAPAVSTESSQGGNATPAPEAISYIVPPERVKSRYLFGAPAAHYDVKNLLVKGFNRVAVRSSSLVRDPQTVLYPALLLGNFSIVKGQNGWVVERAAGTMGTDSWTKYGYPYLSGGAVYRQSFEVPHQYNRLIMRMSQASGVVEIRLNTKLVGKFIWQPIEVDITNLCESKRNELSISVTNTIDNILRMNGRPSGILGDVYLDVS